MFRWLKSSYTKVVTVEKSGTTIVVNGKKLKPGTPEFKKAEASANKTVDRTMKGMDDMFKSMDKMFKDLFDE